MALAGEMASQEVEDDPVAEKEPVYRKQLFAIASAAQFATVLELLALTNHKPFIQHFECDEDDDLVADDDVEATLCDLLAPLRSARQIRRYCIRAYALPTFPLCPSALAESTSHGGIALNTMSSNTTLPVHERMQHVLHNQQSVRPLAGGVPLLQELLMMRWYNTSNQAAAPANNVDSDNEADDETEHERTLRSQMK
jgi:hypothetical protein